MIVCEVCKAERATMLLYALNPGTPVPEPKRNENPFYPPAQAHIALNVCTGCFWDMCGTMRDEQYVSIRATAPLLNKPDAQL